MNAGIGMGSTWKGTATLPALLLPVVLSFVLFFLDRSSPDRMMFGLPHLLTLVLAQALGGAAAASAAAVGISVLVVAAPLLSGAPTALEPFWGVLAGRALVLFAVGATVMVLRQRDSARRELRVHSDTFEDEIARHTTELRRVNVQLHREIAERRRAEHRSRYLASIVESSDDAIIGRSLDGTIVTWNEGATRAYGHDRSKIVGQSASLLVPEQQERELAGILARVSRGERVEAVESVRRRSDGSLFDVSVSVSPILDEQGAIVGAALIERDVTRRKQQEEALRSRNAELEARLHDSGEALDRALGELETFREAVARDLKAPLRALRGFSESLDEECADRLSADEREMLTCIGSAAARMEHVLTELLALSQAGEQVAEKEVVDLASVARRVADELAASDPQRVVEWSIGDGVLAWGDASLLALVVRNLLENAFHYTACRDVGHVSFGVESRDGEAVTYFVHDDGMGFDPALAGDVFRPFRRLHEGEPLERTGVGLATVARIVMRHGGTVSAQGRPGEGAIYRFRLPVPASARSATEPRQASSDAQGAGPR